MRIFLITLFVTSTLGCLPNPNENNIPQPMDELDEQQQIGLERTNGGAGQEFDSAGNPIAQQPGDDSDGIGGDPVADSETGALKFAKMQGQTNLGRTGGAASLSSVSDVLQNSGNMRVGADQMAIIRNCLMKKAHKYPIHKTYWTAVKQFLATDWLPLMTYLCQDEERCWKNLMANFPQWSPSMQREMRRCVSKINFD
jgi:hypothetical protein